MKNHPNEKNIIFDLLKEIIIAKIRKAKIKKDIKKGTLKMLVALGRAW
tara:strand:- start:240 stop:383 length:144 start_codon:yes stop_codon:yes gene_type:complete